VLRKGKAFPAPHAALVMMKRTHDNNIMAYRCHSSKRYKHSEYFYFSGGLGTIYSLSYALFGAISSLLTILIASCVSLATGKGVYVVWVCA